MKDKVRGLIKNKRFGFIDDGWSMHNKACTIYEDMIDNMMIIHYFLLREFGIKSRIGW
jgi:hypothetical protein